MKKSFGCILGFIISIIILLFLIINYKQLTTMFSIIILLLTFILLCIILSFLLFGYIKSIKKRMSLTLATLLFSYFIPYILVNINSNSWFAVTALYVVLMYLLQDKTVLKLSCIYSAKNYSNYKLNSKISNELLLTKVTGSIYFLSLALSDFLVNYIENHCKTLLKFLTHLFESTLISYGMLKFCVSCLLVVLIVFIYSILIKFLAKNLINKNK